MNSTYRLEIRTESPEPETRRPPGVIMFQMVMNVNQYRKILRGIMEAVGSTGWPELGALPEPPPDERGPI